VPLACNRQSSRAAARCGIGRSRDAASGVWDAASAGIAGKAGVGREGCSVGEGLEAASAGDVRAGLAAAAPGVEGESVND